MHGVRRDQADQHDLAYVMATRVASIVSDRPTAVGPITLEKFLASEDGEDGTPEYRAWVARQHAKRTPCPVPVESVEAA